MPDFQRDSQLNKQLAGLANISKGFLGMMETGQRFPSGDMIIRLAEAMRVHPGEMLDAVVARWKANE